LRQLVLFATGKSELKCGCNCWPRVCHTALPGFEGGGPFGDHPTVSHHYYSVARHNELFEFGRDNDHSLALRCQRSHQNQDVGFGADIDACGWLIEKQHVDIAIKPFCDRDLLRIAAAEFRDQYVGRVCFDPEALYRIDAARTFFGLIRHDARHGQALEGRQCRVPPYLKARNQALPHAIFRDQADAGLHGRLRVARQLLATHENIAFAARVRAIDPVKELAPAGSK
jgi:hypothetical protein